MTGADPSAIALRPWSRGLLLLVVLASVLGIFVIPPIAQDPLYHQFADQRTVLGIANGFNVLSNVPFVLLGLLGVRWLPQRHVSIAAVPYLSFSVGALCIGFGSAWYHHAPSMASLVWDRLPMTVVFMSLFSIVVGDRVSARLGRWLLWPLLIFGALSVFYWYVSELQGRGDLRPYGLVQFLPMVLIPLLLLLHPGRGLQSAGLWAALGTYALAKVAEHFDSASAAFISGHSVKHLLGGLALLWALRAMRQRPEI